jgi:hypothetical protein
MKNLRLYGAGLLVALLLTLAACGTNGGTNGGGGSPDFTLFLYPTNLAILQGNRGSATLTIIPLNLFTGTVSLSLVDGSGNPVSGVTLNPTSVSVESNPVNQTLTISAANNAPIGTYDLRVRGVINGVIKEAPLTLEIHPLSAANLRIVKAEWGQTILKENLQLIEGKPALLRVHLAATPVPLSLDQPLAGAVYQGSTFVGNLSFTCPNPIPTTTVQGDLITTCNATLPRDWVAPGLRVEIQVDPNNQVAETDEGDNALTLTPSVGAGTVLYLTVVPVIHYAFGQEKVPSIPNFSPTVWSIWPLKEISYTIRAPYTFSGILYTYGGWVRLLSELRALRQADGSGRYYYGFVKVDYTSSIAGIGYIGYPVAVGWDYDFSAPVVMAHELGHNFGLWHAPCNVDDYVDLNYPYPDGKIGTWGYDLVNRELKDPDLYHDLMSYCGPQWVSDYNYEAVQSFLENDPPSPQSLPQEGLFISGWIWRGEVVFNPPLRLRATPEGKPSPYRILADGVESPAYVLEDSEGALHFQAKLPLGNWNRLALYRDGVLLKEVVAPLRPQAEPKVDLKEVGGFVEVRWTGYPYLSLAHLAVDGGRTTLGLFAQGGEARFPIQGLPRGGHFEVQLSDGLNVQVLLFPR